MSKPRLMYDSVTTGDLPRGKDLYLGYADGSYANLIAVKMRNPKATVVSVTTGTRPNTQIIDRETGDADAIDAARWARAEKNAGRKPTLYVSVSALPELLRALRFQSLKPNDFLIYTAHYTGRPHFCGRTCWKLYGIPYRPDVVATQFADPATSGGHYDLSLVRAHWQGVDPAPKRNYKKAYLRLVRFIHRHKP